ncbi:hypothetical protein C823_007356 [Eubacterium plexicaudatum ASF492]|nr:hypothetical protein C823_007356 [Eubacterium plexicaudatum ASF492]
MKELDYGKMGMRIRQTRKLKGWSQNDLAKKCGISMSFWDILSGERGL